MTKIQNNYNNNIITPAPTLEPKKETPVAKVENQPVAQPNAQVSLSDGYNSNKGINVTSAEIKLASNNNIVNRLISQPPQAGVNELIADLQNKPAGYQATVLNTLAYQSPERTASLLSQGNSSPVLAQALSNAYNAQGSNGGSFIYNIIKNGIGESSITSAERGYNVGQLVARTGNANLIRDFSDKSLTLAHQWRNSNPSAQQISVGLTNGALNAAAGNSTVLKDLINSGKIDVSDIKASAPSGADSLGKVLNVAAKGGFGTQFFLNVAEQSKLVNSEGIRSGMVNYFNAMGGQLVNRLTASENGGANAKRLSEFFGKIALPNSNYRQSIFASNGGFAKAFANTLNDTGKPVTAGTALGNLIGSLEKGLNTYKGSVDSNIGIANQLVGLLNKIPVVGGASSEIGKKIAGHILNKPVKTSQELGQTLQIAIQAGLIQSAQEAESNGNPGLRDSLIQMRTQFSIERQNFLQTYR